MLAVPREGLLLELDLETGASPEAAPRALLPVLVRAERRRGRGGGHSSPSRGAGTAPPPGTAPLLRLVPVGRVLHFTPEARRPPGVLPGRRRARGELGRGGHGTGGAAPGATRTPPAPPRAANPRKILRFLYGAGPEKQLRGGRLRLWLLCKFLISTEMGPVCFSLPFHGFSAPLLMNSFTAQLLRQPQVMLPGAARCRESRSQTQTAASKESSLVLGPFGANWGKKAARGGYGSPGAAGRLGRVSGGLQEEF